MAACGPHMGKRSTGKYMNRAEVKHQGWWSGPGRKYWKNHDV